MKAKHPKQAAMEQSLESGFRVIRPPIPNVLLRDARKQNHWTQEEVANKIGVSIPSIGRWERGEVVPSPYACRKLCKLFNKGAEELGFLGEKETPISTASQELVQTLEVTIGEVSNQNHQVFSLDNPPPIPSPTRTPEELQILLEQQRLVLAEQRLKLHREYLQYVRDLVEIVFPLLDQGATQDLRLRTLEIIFYQIEQVQKETSEEFALVTFPQIKHAFELAKEEDKYINYSKCSFIDIYTDTTGKQTKTKFQAKLSTPNDRLRQAREHLGLSQEELAEQLGVPDARTIGRWERGESFPHPHYRRELSRVLGKSTRELGLVKQMSASEKQGIIPPMLKQPATPLWKVPRSFTPCIGRAQDIEVICTMLKEKNVQLLTILGPGGVGKTRLLEEIADQMRGYFADGICFVSLDAITDSSLVLSEIAQAIGLQENGDQALLETLQSFFFAKQVLLMLDGFEQAATEAPLLEQLFVVDHDLKILVTSQVTLQLDTEHQYPLGPLALPVEGASIDPEELLQYPSVALFTRRAQTFLPTFQLTEQTSKAVAEICIHLDGLPLALELAAAWIKKFPPQTLLTEILQKRFALLKRTGHSGPSRHAALYSAIKRSYDLLESEEQKLFRRLSVFSGGCSFEAVEKFSQIYESQSKDIGSIIFSLIDKSLLRRNPQEEVFPHFTMLETVREFGLECLRANSEWETCQQALCLHYLNLLQEAEPHLKGDQQGAWLERLEGEKENIRTAQAWLIEHGEIEQALHFCDIFGKFCGLRGYWSEEQQWLNKMLNRAEEAPPTLGLARVLRRAGYVAYRFRELSQAQILLEKSVALSQELGDQSNLAGALSILALVMYRQKHITHAGQLLQESLAVARASGDKWALANTLENVGRFAYLQGELDKANAFLAEGITLAKEVADKESLARILCMLVTIQIAQGESEQAEASARESYTLAQELANKPLLALALDGLAEVSFFKEEYQDAAELYEQRLLLARELNDYSTVASKELKLGSIALKRGELEVGSAYIQRSLLFFRKQMDNPNIALALRLQGDVKRMQEDFGRATHAYKEALHLEQEIEHKENIGYCLLGLTRLLLNRGLAEQAAQLLGYVQTCLGSPNKGIYLMLAADYRQVLEETYAQLSQEACTSASDRGNQMNYGEILSFCDYCCRY